jgi:hypothetical protein
VTFTSYRYPLATLVASAPLLLHATVSHLAESRDRVFRALLAVTVSGATVAQLVAALGD